MRTSGKHIPPFMAPSSGRDILHTTWRIRQGVWQKSRPYLEIRIGSKLRTIISRSGEKGQAVIEFPLTFPVFFLTFLIALALAGHFYERHALYQAANKGARVAVTTMATSIDNEVKAEVFRALAPFRVLGLTPNVIQLDYPVVTPPSPDEPVSVTVGAPARLLLTHFFPKLNEQITVKASAFRNYKGNPQGVSTTVGT